MSLCPLVGVRAASTDQMDTNQRLILTTKPGVGEVYVLRNALRGGMWFELRVV